MFYKFNFIDETNKDMVRCFVGVMLPKYLKDNIVKIQQLINYLPIDGKLVEKENLHICLSFLGEVEDEKLGILYENLDRLCLKHGSLSVQVSGIKLIPSEKYVRVIVLNCFSKELESLGKDIEKEVGGDAKPPHITLCRVRKIRDKNQTIEKIKEIKSNVVELEISGIEVIKSHLVRTGPIYNVLHESKLL